MVALCLALPITTFKADGFHRLPRRKRSRPWGGKQDENAEPIRHSSLINPFLSIKRSPPAVLIMNPGRVSPEASTLSSMMLSYARNGLFAQAQGIWNEMLNSSLLPSFPVVLELIDIYVANGHIDIVIQILDQLHFKKCSLLPDLYKHVIWCLGSEGKLELMKTLLKKMTSMGFSVDSATGNAFVIYYSIFGSLSEMEDAYHHLKISQILIEEEAIRAVSFSYIREGKFYNLGKFVEDVGLRRRNVGNLLWNLLLLSYAAKFKMKSLQREFVRMVEGGFHPDLTTFNIRSLAFSQMSLFWDLHLSLEHMKHELVIPDLVTYGSIVDCYLEKGLGKNLDFALSRLNVSDRVVLYTDPVVFEVMGKGGFHSSSEAFMEFNHREDWSYKDLINIYQKKIFRSNQMFWNY